MSEISTKTEQGVKRSRESWFNKVTQLFNRSNVEDATWDELEELLISADVGVATTDKLIQAVKQRAKEDRLAEGPQVRSALKEEMVKLLTPAGSKEGSQSTAELQIVLVVGVNGSGKTTSIAKLAHELNGRGKRVILAAADTFRAAAIDQLSSWGQKLGMEVISHQPGGDPGAVVFDALQAAKNRKVQAVIIDTAGRLHTKYNLMEEMKKINRVAGKYELPQEVILVIDATTGQNGLAQARHFTEAVGVDSIFLTKLDGTARGGIVLAICDQLGIPISYIGTGEQLDDIAPFDASTFVEALIAE